MTERNRCPAGGLLLAAALAAALPLATAAGQQPPASLDAVAALQTAVTEAIAKAEKSVAAVARVKKAEGRLPGVDPAAPPLGLPFSLEESDPTSPGFVPSEFGAGVVIDAKGLILTNYHVLGDVKAADYYVWLNRKPYVARVKAADPWLDLAVLQIEADNLQPLPLGDARTLKRGQFVIALGNPYAIARDGQPSAAWGLVSNLARQAPSPKTGTRPSEGRETLHHWGTLIQTDARLELGSSGGALVDLKGEMVGLTTAYAALAGYEKPGGFAIPVDEDFRRAVEMLKVGRLPDYGFLGVAPRALAAEDRQRGRFGAVVSDVVPATPAAKAGILPNDLVTQVDELPVADDIDLIRILSGRHAGAQVSLTLERGAVRGRPGRKLVLPVTLSKKRPASGRVPISEEPPAMWRGMRVEYATASPLFSDRSRDLDPEGCVGVVEVERDSPAWKAGLRPGDFISHAGNTRVASPAQFHQAVADIAGPVEMKLTADPAGNSVRSVPAP